MQKLTDKQKMFVKEYLIDLNATKAAERAGYSEATAYSQGQRLLKNVEVQGLLQKHMDRRANKLEITAENILNSILDVRNTASHKVPITDKNGEIVAMDMLDKTATLKANELLGKHLKLFTDRVESTNTNVNIDYNELDDEELKNTIKELLDK